MNFLPPEREQTSDLAGTDALRLAFWNEAIAEDDGLCGFGGVIRFTIMARVWSTKQTQLTYEERLETDNRAEFLRSVVWLDRQLEHDIKELHKGAFKDCPSDAGKVPGLLRDLAERPGYEVMRRLYMHHIEWTTKPDKVVKELSLRELAKKTSPGGSDAKISWAPTARLVKGYDFLGMVRLRIDSPVDGESAGKVPAKNATILVSLTEEGLEVMDFVAERKLQMSEAFVAKGVERRTLYREAREKAGGRNLFRLRRLVGVGLSVVVFSTAALLANAGSDLTWSRSLVAELGIDAMHDPSRGVALPPDALIVANVAGVAEENAEKQPKIFS
ncbi:hypothetical protein ACFOGJ_24275 [Marinibaculum pumilum]|uniref:Uncharacterized protein n=1 Tax=Marinibaculum pumilum TaxID=1766165 RepID=A0ABV7L6W0_9PROT